MEKKRELSLDEMDQVSGGRGNNSGHPFAKVAHDCPYCTASFDYGPDLTKHIREMHPDKK